MNRPCPGSSRIRTPELEMMLCPECGQAVEVFSDEVITACPNCGHQISSGKQSCADWCPQAQKCLGAAYDAYSAAKKRRRT